MELVSRTGSFGGSLVVYTHSSKSCAAPMRFSVYLPPQAMTKKLPVLYWLSGLTCNEENFMQKAGGQALAAKHGVILVAPDTSPRKLGIPDEDKDWDLGIGAGFYVNATQPKWSAHYRMYDYISKELPALVDDNFPTLKDRRGIFGHSMGGHGALVIAMREPDRFQSVSAFAPICAPSRCPWGEKAFTAYLGDDRSTWEAYDASILLSQKKYPREILVDQGDEDKFLTNQLMPFALLEAATTSRTELTLRMQPGYDHSYFFIASFLTDHFEHHVRWLSQ